VNIKYEGDGFSVPFVIPTKRVADTRVEESSQCVDPSTPGILPCARDDKCRRPDGRLLAFYVWRIVPYPPLRIIPLRFSVIHLTENVQLLSVVTALLSALFCPQLVCPADKTAIQSFLFFDFYVQVGIAHGNARSLKCRLDLLIYGKHCRPIVIGLDPEPQRVVDCAFAVA